MKPLCNISIDDVSPHPLSSIRVVDRCFELIDRHPGIKFTLFIPIAYWRTLGPTATDRPLELWMYPGFCQRLLQLPSDSFELAYHGYHHGIPHVSNNDEMRDLGHQEALGLIDRMYEGAHKAGLFDAFKSILRPPAWRMSSDCFRACRDKNVMTLALSPDDYARMSYGGMDESYVNVVYYNVNPPFKPLGVFDKTEIVYHACEWDKNYLSTTLMDELSRFLDSNDFRFAFMEELV